MAILLLICVAAFWFSGFLSGRGNLPALVIMILGQISVFCAWEVGYTHFARSDAKAEKHRVVRARNAEIQFCFREEA